MNLAGRLFAVLAVAAATVQPGAAIAPESFQNPPKTNYPETWFHFISGNVSKEGITADLEALAGAGYEVKEIIESPAEGLLKYHHGK